MYQFSIAGAAAQLKNEQEHPFTQLLQRGSLKIEYFAPKGTDQQKPHEQDEVYVIASGGGTFYYDGERSMVVAGNLLFVPAGIEHRFEEFTDDFATWVVFYGPKGGETIEE